MPKSKDVLLGQGEALEEFARLYDVAEKEADAYEQYPPDAVDYARRRAAELRAQAAAQPDVPPDQSAVMAENAACANIVGLLSSFDYGEGAHYPWVKVQFPINDWASRDAFADTIEAIRARHK